ncbi:MAG: putative addiction module antidote protein [Treponema sp.]|jgi:probable addiction module antidote protein|nr:putative addiction module antidote protein [Treponema sp.]
MLKTKKFDVVDYLKTEEEIEAYLNAYFEDGDYKYLPLALADIARARKAMTSAAKAAGVSRTNLYQSLSEDGHPAFETIAKVAQSLGYRLSLVPVSKLAVKNSKKARMSV